MSAVVSRTRTVDASPTEVWTVLADFGGLARWAPDVDHSCLLHGGSLGPGTVRRVQVGRTTLLETVTDWEPPDHLAYVITGLPPALRHVTTSWPAGRARQHRRHGPTTVDAGSRPPQQLLARLVVRRFARAADSMLDGLTAPTSGDHTRASHPS